MGVDRVGVNVEVFEWGGDVVELVGERVGVVGVLVVGLEGEWEEEGGVGGGGVKVERKVEIK